MSLRTKYSDRTFNGPKTSRPKCGARTISGRPCQAQALKPSGRCFRHGGLSTGPRTPEGKARQRQAAKETMRRIWQERRRGERPMPNISDEKRAEMAARARQRQSALQAARDEHLRELRWKKWRADMQEKRREESSARKEAARIRHAERMRRYREKQKKQRANSNA
jgi:hypothetical protein